MTRPTKDIAAELKEAVVVMAETNAEAVIAMTGGNPPIIGTPKIEVRLKDGRIVELGALTDELIASL